ncbi:hypothetical protein KP509_09G079000 [Ceratopteris richardii]|uniref:Uncharacterized protein n=1 Tax=Ceratopteris richardii TaxID=49495 RepID=A0A8T2U8V7_CERRI|nr:hypothetical protein KP509_09G079000 [Ceratopteris richardii]
MAPATRSIRDLIVEVRDARKLGLCALQIPCTSANKYFQDFLSRKRRLIVCNKADLTNPNIAHQRCSIIFTPKTEHEKLKKATVGPLPGVTLNLQGFKIHSKTSIFILDTPGVLVPNISDLDTGLKLALTGAIKDSIVGEKRLCRYLLAFLNSRQAPLKWKKSIEEARAKEEEARKLLVEKAKPKTLLELKRQAYLAQKDC